MRRASATIARLAPRRRASFAAQVRSQLARPRCIMTVAAWHSARRRLTSPALVIPPENVTVLAQGMLSQDLLEERILHAGDAAGLITGQARKDAFPEHRGILTPEDIKEIGREMDKNPKGLTPSVQQRIEKRF